MGTEALVAGKRQQYVYKISYANYGASFINKVALKLKLKTLCCLFLFDLRNLITPLKNNEENMKIFTCVQEYLQNTRRFS